MCGPGLSWARLTRIARACGAGHAVFLEGIEELPARHRLRLLELEVPLVVTLTCESLDAARASGLLRPSDARRLAALESRVPSLAERRADVLELAARTASEFGAGAARLSSAASAWLWRQDWPGNVRQLQGFVRAAVTADAVERATGTPTGRRGVVGSKALPAVARSVGLEVRDPGHPRETPAELVCLALAAARRRDGRVNRRRAAELLGWHPETLARRSRELGLAGPRPKRPGEPPGTACPAER